MEQILFPAPARKKPAPLTREQINAKRVEAIRATCLTKKAFESALQNEGFSIHRYPWIEPSEAVKESITQNWLQRQLAGLSRLKRRSA
jgi:hypothetical protein